MIRALITDIEGTTSSLSFVKDVLFPYSRAYIGAFVHRHAQEPEVARILDEARAEAGDSQLQLGQLIPTLERWIDADRKVTPLKALQGLIWEAGYRDGAFRGHIYADAATALQRWKEAGLALYIYSSGSVRAQRLLFAHTDYGDLTPLFSGHFDTRIGAKGDPESYRRIAVELGLPPHELLFLSDVESELDAARAAGLKTLWLVREGCLDSHAPHRQARDFSEIDPLSV
ncbi:MAG: acireductone synthase [Chromatiaceae bacterium]|jgi:enolase-phosphatase E1